MTTPAALELGERDDAIMRDLLRVRLLTGWQLERLHFRKLSATPARGSARRRTMGRLARLGLVTTLPRRVGGERAGSAGLVYLLDSRGVRLLTAKTTRVRRPWPVGWPFVQHTLDIAELYVRLREQERANRLRLLHFEAEPASWYSQAGVQLKPDAFVVLETDTWEEHYWLEVDRGTESLPGLGRKLRRYVDAAAAAPSAGPLGVIPRVLLTVPDMTRHRSVAALVRRLPDPGAQLISVEPFAGTFRHPP